MFLAGPDTGSTRLRRKELFLSLWAKAQAGTGQPFAPEVVHVPRYAQSVAGARLLDHLRVLPDRLRPDVVLCENDVLALGAVDAIRHGLGLRVPQDIAVTGFDDIPFGASPAYDLTTYRQPIARMARALVDVLQGRETGGIVLPGQFIARGSG
jgi:DNA-binding LacI/PurR family transcriptional regulator